MYKYDKSASLVENFNKKTLANIAFLKNTTVVSLKKDNNKFDLYSLSLLKKEKDKSFLYNKINTIKTYMNDFDLFFITFTLAASVHNHFNLASDFDKISLFRLQKTIFQDFHTYFQKQRFFRSCRKDSRFYIKASEVQKSGVLHEHQAYFIKKEYSSNFINTLVNSLLIFREKNELLGRTEIVIKNDFKKQIKKISTYVKNVGYVLNDELKNVSSGNFVYFKFLRATKKHKDEDSKIVNYTVKYVLKELYNNDLNNTTKTQDELFKQALYSFSRVRKVNFSRFLFSRCLYDNLKDANNVKVYDKYTLRELTDLKNTNKIKYEYTYKFKFNFNTSISSLLNDYIFEDDYTRIDACISSLSSLSFDFNRTTFINLLSNSSAYCRTINDLLEDNYFSSIEDYNYIKSNIISKTRNICYIENIRYFCDTSIKYYKSFNFSSYNNENLEISTENIKF